MSKHTVSKESSDDENIYLIEKSFYNNLLLLGLDVKEYNDLYGVVVSEQMFRTVNVKGMQYVLYFLFSKIFEDHENIFKSVWPILDKKQASQFKTIVKDLLKRLESEGKLPPGTSRMSYLQTCHGETFCRTIWKLSNIALKVQLDLLNYPTPHFPGLFDASSQSFSIVSSLLTNINIINRSTKSQINIQTMKFLENANKIAEEENLWKETAVALEKEYRAIMEEKRKLDIKLQKLSSIEKDLKSYNQVDINQSVLESWDKLIEHIQNHKKHMKKIDDITKNKANEFCIDGQDLIVDENHQSKADISKLIQFWNSSITETFLKLQDLLISKKTLNNISQDDKPEDILEKLTKFKLQHKQQSRIIKQSIQNLRQDIINVENSIQKLKGSTENSLFLSNQNTQFLKTEFSTPQTDYQKLIPPTPSYETKFLQSPSFIFTPPSKQNTTIFGMDKNDQMFDYSFDDDEIIEKISSDVKNSVLNKNVILN